MDIIKFVNGLDDVSCSKTLPTLEDVKEAEEKLGVKFAEDYVQVLLNYGKLSVRSMELTGLSYCDTSSQATINMYNSTDVVYQTLSARSLDCHDQVPANMYVIEDVGIDMLLIWQDESGAVYSTLPWSEPEKEADSLAEYIKICYEEDEDDDDDYDDDDYDDDDDEDDDY